VILDASNVISNVVFAIPSTVATPDFHCDLGPDGKMTGNCMPSKIMYTEGSTGILNFADGDTVKVDPTAANSEIYVGKASSSLMSPPNTCPDAAKVSLANKGGASDVGPALPDLNSPFYKKTIMCWKKMDLSKYEQNNASMFMMFSVAKVQSLTEASISKSEPSLTKVTIASIFTIVIQLVYIISFLALYVLMVARIVILWLFMAFSPLLVLFMIGHDFGLSFGGAEEKLSISQFINWAFAPAKVGAVMTIGFLMIMAGQRIGSLSNDTGIASSDSMTYIETNTLFSGIDNLQQFIWLIMVTVIIWMGTWSVLHGYEAVDGMLHGIKESFEGGAKLIAKAPFKVPFIPTKGGKKSIYDYSPQEFISQKFKDVTDKDASLAVQMSSNVTHYFNNLRDTEKNKFKEDAKSIGGAEAIINTLKAAGLDPKFIKAEYAASIATHLSQIEGFKDLNAEQIENIKEAIKQYKPEEKAPQP
jgi:hypothetical protein